MNTYGMKVIKNAPYVDLTFEKLSERFEGTHGQFKRNERIIKIYLPQLKRYPECLAPTVEHEGIHVGLDDVDFLEEEEEDMIDAMLQARWEEAI